MSLYVLTDDHGETLGEFETEAAAVRALTDLVNADPQAADDCYVVLLDDQGRRTSEPIRHGVAA